eukprot:6732608-Alexandrium_andersonii.AAC.1
MRTEWVQPPDGSISLRAFAGHEVVVSAVSVDGPRIHLQESRGRGRSATRACLLEPPQPSRESALDSAAGHDVVGPQGPPCADRIADAA